MEKINQTAVEWLVQEIEEKHNFRFGNFYWAEIQQAKAMEKEQIMEAFKHGKLPTFLGKSLTSEQYYQETYSKTA